MNFSKNWSCSTSSLSPLPLIFLDSSTLSPSLRRWNHWIRALHSSRSRLFLHRLTLLVNKLTTANVEQISEVCVRMRERGRERERARERGREREKEKRREMERVCVYLIEPLHSLHIWIMDLGDTRRQQLDILTSETKCFCVLSLRRCLSWQLLLLEHLPSEDWWYPYLFCWFPYLVPPQWVISCPWELSPLLSLCGRGPTKVLIFSKNLSSWLIREFSLVDCSVSNMDICWSVVNLHNKKSSNMCNMCYYVVVCVICPTVTSHSGSLNNPTLTLSNLSKDPPTQSRPHSLLPRPSRWRLCMGGAHSNLERKTELWNWCSLSEDVTNISFRHLGTVLTGRKGTENVAFNIPLEEIRHFKSSEQ